MTEIPLPSIVPLTLPVVIEAADYHEFDGILDTLRAFGARGVKFHELGCDYDYYAVFYVGRLKNAMLVPKVAKIAKQLKEVDNGE